MKKNYLLYIFEFIASIFVIFIHCKFYGFFGDIVETIARFAVPFFFIITGYYGLNKMTEKIKKYTLIFIKLMLLYFVLRVAMDIIFNTNYIYTNLSIKNVLFFILFNTTTFTASHLWYLMALIYCYILISLIDFGKNYKFFLFLPLIVIPLSIIVNSSYDMKYSAIFRNWLTIGMPFISIGYCLKLNKDRLTSINNNKVIFFIIFGVILSCIERLLLKYAFNIKSNIYFGSIIIAVSIMILCLNNSDKLKELGSKVSKLSTNIYYYHYIFIIIFNQFSYIFNTKLFQFIQPLIIALLSILVSYLLIYIKRSVKYEN